MYNEQFFDENVFEKTVFDTSDGETFDDEKSAATHIVSVDTQIRIMDALRCSSPMVASSFSDEQLRSIAVMMTANSYEIVRALTEYNDFMEKSR